MTKNEISKNRGRLHKETSQEYRTRIDIKNYKFIPNFELGEDVKSRNKLVNLFSYFLYGILGLFPYYSYM